MKLFTQSPLTLALGALLTAGLGCSKDAAPDSMGRDVIIETGYIECGAPDAEACDGVAQCVEANDAQICVQAPADQCADALTCDCVGAWVCGELPCADVGDGFTCGADPQPGGCLRVAPGALDFGEVLVGETATQRITLIADCPATLGSLGLSEDTDRTFSIANDPDGLGGPIAAGDTLDIELAVTPVEPGPLQGTLEINDDPALAVALTAAGARPIGGNCLMAEPGVVDFGVVVVGSSARRTVDIAINCDGALQTELRPDDSGRFQLVGGLSDGPVQAGEAFEAVVRLDAIAPGEVRGSLILAGVGQPLTVTLRATVVADLPDCRDAGVGCLGGLACNAAGRCVTPTRFVLDLEDGAEEMYLQLWPVADPPFLLIESADSEFTAFNPGSIFEPCDACDAAPDCAARPDIVGAASQLGDYTWDQTWWLSDTPDGDDCARAQQAPDGLYVAILCGAREADVEGEFGEDGRAEGTINQSFCLPAVQFDMATGGDVVIPIPAQ